MRRALPIFLSGVFLLLPAVVLAQLVPCDGVVEKCQACHVVELGQKIIEFLVSIAAFLAVLLFAYAGFLMLTAAGNAGQIEKGKGVFTNVLVGIIIVLVGWLVVDTVMKWAFQGMGEGDEGSELYEDTKTDFGPWNQINCVDQPAFNREGTGRGATGLSPDELSSGAWAHLDADARRRLEDEGVRIVSSGGCSDPNRSNCTSLAGMQDATVEQISIINQACSGCNVTVTGGTEAGHAGGDRSHSAGYKVDIDDNSSVDRFFEEHLQDSGEVRSGAHGGKIYYDSCGNEYVRESNHWDITVTRACSL